MDMISTCGKVKRGVVFGGEEEKRNVPCVTGWKGPPTILNSHSYTSSLLIELGVKGGFPVGLCIE